MFDLEVTSPSLQAAQDEDNEDCLELAEDTQMFFVNVADVQAM